MGRCRKNQGERPSFSPNAPKKNEDLSWLVDQEVWQIWKISTIFGHFWVQSFPEIDVAHTDASEYQDDIRSFDFTTKDSPSLEASQ